MRLALAALCLLAVPAQAQTATVSWAPVVDAHHYQLRFRTATETWIERTPQPSLAGVTVPMEEHWLDVRACSETFRCGGWSPYYPSTADCNEDGGVGLRDYPCRRSFGDLWANWGKRTEVVPGRDGIRRYSE